MAEASATPIIETAPEEWRPVVDAEIDYEVSNYGRVRRLNYSNGHVTRRPYPTPRVLKPIRSNTGYLNYQICSGGRVSTAQAHALVAAAFIGPRPAGHEVAHLDGNRQNPSLSNLAYVTPTENQAHMLVHGTANRQAQGTHSGRAKLTAEQVREMRAERRRLGRRISFRRLAERYGVGMETARDVCNGVSYRNVV